MNFRKRNINLNTKRLVKGLVTKMKKKLLSVLLTVAIVFSFASPALAEDVTTPAESVEFGSVVGKNGGLVIETTIEVLNVWNENITEYPTLYTVEDGVLSLVPTSTPNNGFCAFIRDPDSDDAAPRYVAHISLNFTDAEYLVFDFTADYVLKIPAGIYKDPAGNPIGQQCVTFSGPDIEITRYEMTTAGKLYFVLRDYLYSLITIPALDSLKKDFDNAMRALFRELKIPLFRLVTAV